MTIKFTKTIAMGACAALAIVSQAAQAADHRDSYAINLRPSANLADIFVFKSPENSDNIVLGLTVLGLSDPDNSPSYAFEHATKYQIAIDTDGDAVFDNTLDIVFDKPVADPETKAYSQSYSFSMNGDVLLTANSTPASIKPIAPAIHKSNDITVFAGAVDDPFFADVAGFSLQNFPGRDSFAGMNVLSIMVEMPFSMISNAQDKISVSGFVYDADGSQIDRMGTPLVNAAVIPSELRDTYNASRPKDDVTNFGDTLGPLAPDVLRFDAAAPGSFPNGRHPSDDVVGLLLQLDDKVDSNDKLFPTTFPYLAEPHLPE